MANRRFIDFPIASTVGDNDIVLIWQDGLNKQTTKGTLIQGAPTTLEGLTDVDIAGLINGQILQYNSVTGKWENVDQAGLNLSELGDVSIVSPSNGQVLVYNSTTSKWENSSGGYVPYTGAVTTVDLGAQGLRAGYIRFDTSVVSVPNEQGLMYWDDSRSTAALIMNGTLQHIGQDTFFYVKNASGSSIAKGTAVRFDGTDGASGHLLIAPFLANGTYPSNYFMGVTAETIASGSFGQVMHFGELSGINTSGYTAGALLYASTTVAGSFQTTAPVAPNNIVLIAAAINSKNNGDILVRPTYGSNINQDEGVKIVSPTTGQLLQLQSNGLWENKTKAQVLGGTSSQFVKGDGSLDSTTYQSTADKGQPNGYASLDSNGKVPLAQINDALIGNVNYQGLWNASTNTPTLANPPSSGTKGYYYIVSTAGTFAGISFEVGDWIISNGTAWQKVDNTDAVSSVFGRTGNVVAANGDYTTAQVTESGNLYFTNARSRQAISLTTSGTSGAATYDNSTGVFNIPNYGSALSGYLPLTGGTLTGPLGGTSASFSGNLTVSSGNVTGGGIILADDGDIVDLNDGYASLRFSLGVRIFSANRGGSAVITLANTGAISANGNITGANLSGTNTGDVTIGTGNGLSLSGQALSLGLSSGSANGALSSTDWTTFNNKQNALTNPVTGTGTTNYLPKFTGSTTIGNSLFFDDGTRTGIGINSLSNTLFTIYDSSVNGDVLKIESTISKADIWLNSSTGSNGAVRIRGESNSLRFIAGGDVRATIFNDGNFLLTNGSGSNAGFKLDVNGTGRFSSTAFTNLFVDGTNSNGWGNNIAFRSQGTDFGYLGSLGSLLGSTVKDMTIWATSGNGFRVNVNGSSSSALTITSGGNVGIGIDSPTNYSGFNTLHINGKSGTNGGVLRLTAFDNSSSFNIYAAASAANFNTTSAIPFVWLTQDTPRMTITSGGNVGIGTNGPNQKLEVNGRIRVSSNGTNGGDMAVDDGGIAFSTQGATPIAFWRNNYADHSMRITSGGNVLIGTQTDNSNKLRVEGSGYFSNDLTVLGFSGLREVSGLYFSPNGTNVPSIGMYRAGVDAIGFSTNTTPRLIIASNGNLLIGTQTDTSDKLRVNGNTFTNTLMTWNPENDNRSGVAWRFGAASIASITPNRRLRVSVNGIEYYIGAVEV